MGLSVCWLFTISGIFMTHVDLAWRTHYITGWLTNWAINPTHPVDWEMMMDLYTYTELYLLLHYMYFTFFKIFGLSDFWIFESCEFLRFLGFWFYNFLNFWIFQEFLDFWINGYLDFWISGFLEFMIFWISGSFSAFTSKMESWQ